MVLTAISSSPRPGSNSDLLIDRVVAAARACDTSVEKYQIGHAHIGGCTACEACQESLETRCVYDDEALPILESIRASDSVVFGAPIYCFGVAAQLKLLIDRMFSFGGDGNWDALAGRTMGVVLTYGDKDRAASGVRNAVGMFTDMARFLKMEIGGVVEVSCYDRGEVAGNDQALARADELGRRLAQTVG